MRWRSSCPEGSTLEALLTGSLPEAEQANIVRHLDDCERCRRTLEQLAPSQDEVLRGATSGFDWAENGDSVLQAAIDRLTYDDEENQAAQSEPSGDDKVSLDFLSPSDHPEHLGRLGPYEITQVIGQGGMGVVLKGHDSQLNRFVAIKVLTPQLASNATARKRFRREGQAAAAVSHRPPGLVGRSRRSCAGRCNIGLY